MRIKIIVICFLLITLSSCTIKPKNDFEKMNLKRNVKYVCEVVYQPKLMFGKYVNGQRLGVSKEITFNEEGNKMVEEFSILGTTFFRKDVYSYNAEGYKIGVKVYNSIGKLHSSYKYKNDSSGKEIECNKYDSIGNWVSRYLPIYDSNGNKIEYNKYHSNGKFELKYTYKYDSDGNEIEYSKGIAIWYPSFECNNTRLTSYDSNGNVNSCETETLLYSEGFMDELEVVDCDLYTNFRNGNFYFSNYKYDNKSWIRKVLSTDKKCIAIIEREIKYY